MSSRRLYEHRCENGHVSTHYVRYEEKEQVCPECETCATRIISAHKVDLYGLSKAGCPGAYERVGNDITRRHKSVDQHHRTVE